MITTVPRMMTLPVEADDATQRVASSLMSEEAFRAFYDRTSRGLWLYLSRVTGDRQLADDLVQEAFYRFYRAGDAYESDRHRRNALYTIATNAARDTWRRRHGVELVAIDEGHARSTPSASVDARTDIERAMAQLEPRQREMLWLAYANGSSHDEIAEATGVKKSSVKSLLFRARKRFVEAMGSGRPHVE